MYYFLLQAHSGWRWIVLILLVIVAVKALVGWLGKQKWNAADTRLLLFARVALYIQVVLGIILYILLQYWNNMRFTGEHVIVALVAVGALEFGAARAKKSTDSSKMYMYAFIGSALALILIYVALLAVGGIFT
jgi:hypothetical protein